LDEALESIEQALLANPDELVYLLEILRMRGELWLKLRRSEEAEADFCEALTLAAGMSAKSWELRATTNLARLFTEQGHYDEARMMLVEIYNWFTEGFDTADLKKAKTATGGTGHLDQTRVKSMRRMKCGAVQDGRIFGPAQRNCRYTKSITRCITRRYDKSRTK
jgi:hypothetical protein